MDLRSSVDHVQSLSSLHVDCWCARWWWCFLTKSRSVNHVFTIDSMSQHCQSMLELALDFSSYGDDGNLLIGA
jgi:hypothetical protein